MLVEALVFDYSLTSKAYLLMNLQIQSPANITNQFLQISLKQFTVRKERYLK